MCIIGKNGCSFISAICFWLTIYFFWFRMWLYVPNVIVHRAGLPFLDNHSSCYLGMYCGYLGMVLQLSK